MPPPRSFTEQLRQDPPQGTPAIEECFLMRCPPEVAMELRQLIDEDKLGDRLQIQVHSHKRYVEVVLKRDPNNPHHNLDMEFKGKLLDLPTVNEIYKTIDNKNMYKCADLHQLLNLQYADEYDECEKEFADSEDDKFDPGDPKQVAQHDKMYQYPHGLCPPFKNIRRQRFRKTAKKKMINATELEKEVKGLLRDDNDGNVVETTYTIEYEEVDLDKVKEKSRRRKWHNYVSRQKAERAGTPYGNQDPASVGISNFDEDSKDAMETGTPVMDDAASRPTSTTPKLEQHASQDEDLFGEMSDMSGSDDDDVKTEPVAMEDIELSTTISQTTVKTEPPEPTATDLNTRKRTMTETLQKLQQSREALKNEDLPLERRKQLEDDSKNYEVEIDRLKVSIHETESALMRTIKRDL